MSNDRQASPLQQHLAALRHRAWLAQANPRLLARLLKEIRELERKARA